MLNAAENSENSRPEVKAPTNPLLRMGPFYNLLCALAVGIFAWASGFTGLTPVGTSFLIVAGVFLGAVYAVSSTTINSLIYSASEILFAPYGVNDRVAAYRFLETYLLSGHLPILIITEGKVDPRTISSPMVKFGRGPGRLEVDNVSVALIERGGNFRIVTARSQFLDKFDRIVGFLDLRTQRSEFSKLPNVFTKDNIPLGISTVIQYRIMRERALIPKRGQPGPNINAVLSALSASDWKTQIETTMRGKTRDLLAEYDLNDIHGSYPEFHVGESMSSSQSIPERTPSPRVPLQIQLKEGLDEAIRVWGAEVLLVTVDEITMPDEVQKTLREAWAAHWQNTMDIEKADKNAVVERIDAEGQRAAAEIKKEAALIDAQAAAESHRIKAMVRADMRLEMSRIMEAIRQVTGRDIDDTLRKEMLRDVINAFPETRSEYSKRSSKPEEGNGGDSNGEAR